MSYRVKIPATIRTDSLSKLGDSVTNLSKWCEDELNEVASQFQSAEPQFIWNSVPPKPRRGMVVYADGVNWNPGAGEGPYYFNGSVWTSMKTASGGTFVDAPSDGSSYGRKNGAWSKVLALSGGTLTGILTLSGAPVGGNDAATKTYVDSVAGTVPSPSVSVPIMDGVGAVGVATTYARGDHVHPSDTSKAPTASPTFTGTVTVPTPAVDNNSTAAASTAYVIGQASAVGDGTPAMDGTAARGAAIHWARADHIHPTDTSRAPTASPTLTGTVTIPTVVPSTDSSTKAASTAFVQNAIAAVSSGVTNITASAPLSGGGTGNVTIGVAASPQFTTAVGVNIAPTKATVEAISTGNLFTNSENGPNGLEIASGHVVGSDWTLYMGADATTGCSYIQSVKWGTSTGPLILNGRGGGVGILGTGTITGGPLYSTGNATQLQTNHGAGTHGYADNRWSNDTFGGSINLTKSRGATIGTNTIVQNGDSLGEIDFNGNDGTGTYAPYALILATVDGSPVAGTSAPGRLNFQTTASGSVIPTTQISVASTGITTFTQIPVHPSPAVGDSSTKSATTAFVRGAIGEVIYAANYGVLAANSASANGVGLAAAITAASAFGGCQIVLPPGTINITPFTISGTNAITLVGQGMGPGSAGTTLQFNNTTGHCITWVGGSFGGGLKDLSITSSVKMTSDFAVYISGDASGVKIENVFISYTFNGIWVSDSAETIIINVELRYLLGVYGVRGLGTVGHGVFGWRIDHLICDNPYPAALVYPYVVTWAISTAFAVGKIINNNGNIYQCTTAGTSAAAGTGPSGIPGTTGANAFTTTINDGTAKWQFICANSLAWVLQDSYAYSLALVKSALIDGAYGFRMADAAVTGSSYPTWAECYDLETDHNLVGGVYLAAGLGFYDTSGWHGSCLTGNGVTLDGIAGYRGDTTLTQCHVTGNWQYGVLINPSGGNPLNTSIIGGGYYLNGQQTSGTFHNIALAANTFSVTITGVFAGRGPEGSGQTGYGIFGGTGLAFVVVTNNVLAGNLTGGSNLTTGGTVIYANNVG